MDKLQTIKEIIDDKHRLSKEIRKCKKTNDYFGESFLRLEMQNIYLII